MQIVRWIDESRPSEYAIVLFGALRLMQCFHRSDPLWVGFANVEWDGYIILVIDVLLCGGIIWRAVEHIAEHCERDAALGRRKTCISDGDPEALTESQPAP